MSVLATGHEGRDNRQVAYILPDQPRAMPALTCCGRPMIYQEFFGIRRYQCEHRSHHPVIYVNQNTGERVTDEDLPWTQP